MYMQDKEILLEVVPGENIKKDVRKLRALGNVAGLRVNLTVKDGKTFLSVNYSDEFTEFIRNRNAGRPREKRKVQLTCGEVFALKKAEGAKIAAATLQLPIATFYRRYNENKGKKEEESFV